jgi:hypothetical protein
MKHELARRKALVDAAAGVIGSLVSMLVFYPLDVWKTNLQAGTSKHECRQRFSTDTEANDVDSTVINVEKAHSKQWIHQLSRLFRGLSYKIAHTTVSSFTYFYVYSLVQTKYFAHRRLIASRQGIESKITKISTVTKLALAAFSAMINTIITLPLDTLSSRMQAGTHEVACIESNISGKLLDRERSSKDQEDNPCPSKPLNRASNRAHNDSAVSRDEYNSIGNKSPSNQNRSQLYISSPEKFKFSFSTNLREEAFTPNPIKSTESKQRLQSILSLWNGLLPAILLCSNPAIQYTMYDTLKSSLLLHRQKVSTNQHQSTQSNNLSMKESFLFGLISKFVATIITYPLIRAKVMMMVAPESLPSDESHLESTTNCTNKETNHKIESGQIKAANTLPQSLLLLLLYIFKKDGVGGLYRGCSLQLLHTVLKSALLLMVREKISVTTRKFFQIEV